MKKLSIFDPAMCCSTGVCGPDPDQALIDFASDFDWLKAHGVPAERWNLANQPMAFVLNHKASAFLRAKGSDALPLILVDNEERLSGRYPSRSELSEWFGIPMTACERARELEKSTGISAEAVCGPECGCGESPKASSQSTLKDTVSGLKFNKERALETARGNFCTAAELANTIVRHDHISFRTAHEIVAEVVNRMIAGNLKADETGLSVIAPVFRDVVGRETTMTEDDVRSGLDPKRIAMAKRVTGGTAPDEVARQLESRLRAIESDDAELAHRIGRVADAKAKLEREVHEVIG